MRRHMGILRSVNISWRVHGHMCAKREMSAGGRAIDGKCTGTKEEVVLVLTSLKLRKLFQRGTLN